MASSASSQRKRVVLLGATGSIGENTLRVIAAHRDRLELVGIAARGNWPRLAAIAGNSAYVTWGFSTKKPSPPPAPKRPLFHRARGSSVASRA